jgi:hypothetical protein
MSKKDLKMEVFLLFHTRRRQETNIFKSPEGLHMSNSAVYY